jgi:hypothetical protein
MKNRSGFPNQQIVSTVIKTKKNLLMKGVIWDSEFQKRQFMK